MLSQLPRIWFSTHAITSIPGHKPPAFSDNAVGRYAGSLFTAASKAESLNLVLDDMKHLQSVIKAEESFREFLKNTAMKRREQRGVIGTFAPENYSEVTVNFLDTLIEAGR